MKTIRLTKWIGEVYKNHSIVFTVGGSIMSAFLGGYVSLHYFEPYHECVLSEIYFFSALDAVKNEVKANDNLLTRMPSHIEGISDNSATTIEQKQQNLMITANMSLLQTTSYMQLNQYYLELPILLKEKYANTFSKITQAYKFYDQLNGSIRLMQSTVIASLGFRADLYSRYLPFAKNDLSDSYENARKLNSGALLISLGTVDRESSCHWLDVFRNNDAVAK